MNNAGSVDCVESHEDWKAETSVLREASKVFCLY